MLALLFLDLDRFKYVNDTLGHEAGDQLLLDVAGRIRAAVRSGDVVARQSGDEFLVLLRELGRPEYAGLAARKIIEAVGRAVQLGEAEVNVGVSIGIAVLNETNPSLEPFDIKLLQVLFLIRYVEEIKGNVNNLVTLCIDEIDADRLGLRRKIEESLQRLEKETLISRSGDNYFFLTNEETVRGALRG